MKAFLSATALTLSLANSAFANDSRIDQIGTSNSTTITQSGGIGGTSTVLQTGNNDVAMVTQSDGGFAGSNASSIEQLAGSGTQTASVTQDNALGGPTNTAKIIQNSTEGGNRAAIDQSGDDNFAEAQQGPGEANNCTAFGCSPTAPADITNSGTTINQSGSANIASTMQIVGSNGGDNNIADVDQDGSGNEASVLQGTGAIAAWWGLPNPSSNDNDNMASIGQSGVGNISDIEQGGESGMATSLQDGTSNISSIVQSGGLPGFGNTAMVDQTGEGNDSTVEQSSIHGDLPIVPALSTAIVTQDGFRNTSIVAQSPIGGHMATVMQVGEDHDSTITQDGLFNVADLTQRGLGQISTISQTGPSFFTPLLSEATVSQTVTNGNNSSISQDGIGQMANVMQ